MLVAGAELDGLVAALDDRHSKKIAW